MDKGTHSQGQAWKTVHIQGSMLSLRCVDKASGIKGVKETKKKQAHVEKGG